MSELLQSGQHPDADQLSAFVEHALPPHEQQQTLAHLAVCPDCRGIVALSLPAVDESPGPLAEPVRKPWFLGWSFALPAGAALAGLVLFVIVHVRDAGSTRNIVAPIQMAVSQAPMTLPAPAAPSVPTPKQPLALSSKPLPSSSRHGAAMGGMGGAKATDRQNIDGATNAQGSATLPIRSRNFADQVGRKPAPLVGVIDGPLPASANGAGTGLSMGALVGPSKTAPDNALDRPQQDVSGAAAGNLNRQSSAAAPAAAPA